jgi:hypothetical protein
MIEAPPSPDLEIVVVIPCYCEPDLIITLQSLNACLNISSKIEVLIIVNQSDLDTNQVRQQNQETCNRANHWIRSQTSGISFHIFNQTLPVKHAGVGLARKIGMDEAVRRFARLNKDGIIACLDADCTVKPNYFQALLRHFKNDPKTPGCSIYFEHALEGPLPMPVYQAIADYELHLRYYIHGLKFSGLPSAFQTVGSSMAVRSSAYQKQGGMNKRKAGEDFYFLQKIIKLGGFTELNDTTVFPSSRMSTRVPFGTGKAIADSLQTSGRSQLTYHPKTFEELKKLISLFMNSFQGIRQEDSIWNSIPAGFQAYITKNQIIKKLQELNSNTSSPTAFKKRLFQWCDGFFAFKFANYLRENHYPPIPVTEAASWLLKEAYEVEAADNEIRELLMKYRNLDRKNNSTRHMAFF